METYITICKIYSPWEFAVWLRKLKQGLGINLEGWDGAGDGREVQKGGDICIPLADSRWGLTENSKILWSNYPSIKNKLIKKDISSLKIKNCFFEEYLGMRFFFFFFKLYNIVLVLPYINMNPPQVYIWSQRLGFLLCKMIMYILKVI